MATVIKAVDMNKIDIEVMNYFVFWFLKYYKVPRRSLCINIWLSTEIQESFMIKMNKSLIEYNVNDLTVDNLNIINCFVLDVLEYEFGFEKHICQYWSSGNVQDELDALMLRIFQKTYYTVQR